MTKIKFTLKWKVFMGLAILGILIMLFLPGYDFSGLTILGFAALIPLFSGIKILQRTNPRLGKAIMRIICIFLAVFFCLAAATLGIIADTARGAEDPSSEYLLVLGAGVNGTIPSMSLRERINAAFHYLNEHPDSIAIVSGGQGEGEDITEAACMTRELVKMGIPEDRIWAEENATRTLENLQFSLDLIEERTDSKPDRIAIVSSEYHLHRAGIFAQWLGIEAELIPARTNSPFLRLNYYLREIFAVWYYTVFGG